MDAGRAKSLAGGLLFAALGLAAAVAAWGYSIGTPGNMGPGFFPVLLGALLALLGLLNAATALRGAPAGAENARIGRSLMLPLGIFVFGLLVERAGVIASTLALVACVWLAGFGFKLWEIVAVAAVLVVIACALFVYGLQLPVSYLLPS